MGFAKFDMGDGEVLIEIAPGHSDTDAAVEPGRFKTANSVEPKVVQRTATKLVDALKDAIAPNSAAIIAACRAVDVKPDEIEVTFGLKAAVEGGVAFFGVAKATAEANYTVTMTWKNPQK